MTLIRHQPICGRILPRVFTLTAQVHTYRCTTTRAAVFIRGPINLM
jgi:hypothetical protein